MSDIGAKLVLNLRSSNPLLSCKLQSNNCKILQYNISMQKTQMLWTLGLICALTFERDLVGSTYANDININSFLFISNQNDESPAAGLSNKTKGWSITVWLTSYSFSLKSSALLLFGQMQTSQTGGQQTYSDTYPYDNEWVIWTYHVDLVDQWCKFCLAKLGLGYVNAVCGTLRYRIAISEYYYDDLTSAEVCLL